MQYSFEVASDAGLLREFVIRRYGYFFAHGGSIYVANLARRHVRRLAKMTGIDVASIIADIREDYQLLIAEA